MSDYSEYIKPFLKAFDEACAKASENGAKNERKRIIKALENAKFEREEIVSKQFTDGVIWAVKETILLLEGGKSV